mmetsp:Transcript_5041/g.7095  ORF Transcript_5041/g.7095 Transcript_5041/m.7095 type:complete len:326 (-) Transcript_5041:191-1168(-)
MRNLNNMKGCSDEEEWEFLSAASDDVEETSLLLREEEEYHIEEIEEEELEQADTHEIESSGVVINEEIEDQNAVRNSMEIEIPPHNNGKEEEDAMSTEDEGVVGGLSNETKEGNVNKIENEFQTISESSASATNENDDFIPGLYILKDMGFSHHECKAALAACDGNVEQAVCVLLGEHQEWRDTSMNNPFQDASRNFHHNTAKAAASLKHRARSVGRTVGREAERVCDDVKMACARHDLPGKAKIAGHRAKLTARTVGREAKSINEKFHITDALATAGIVVAAAAVAMGNPRAATAAVAMAGSAFVAGEGMKYSNERRGNDSFYD